MWKKGQIKKAEKSLEPQAPCVLTFLHTVIGFVTIQLLNAKFIHLNLKCVFCPSEQKQGRKRGEF